jgi:exodeoxyribonuclease VII small subunit
VSKKAKENNFEATLADLEELVAKLESGDLPLDEALKQFELGVKLTRECQQQLQSAQQRVQVLLQQSGAAQLADFAAAASGE